MCDENVLFIFARPTYNVNGDEKERKVMVEFHQPIGDIIHAN